ncbi:MAG: hypothetical protein HRU03_09290 [Nanoarchaeales archaeon]|nr:hypothetical protein [Nanoarchaeales archaeon]
MDKKITYEDYDMKISKRLALASVVTLMLMAGVVVKNKFDNVDVYIPSEKVKILERHCVAVSYNVDLELRKKVEKELDCFSNFSKTQRDDIEITLDKISSLTIESLNATKIKKLAKIEQMIKLANYLDEKYSIGETLLNVLIADKHTENNLK